MRSARDQANAERAHDMRTESEQNAGDLRTRRDETREDEKQHPPSEGRPAPSGAVARKRNEPKPPSPEAVALVAWLEGAVRAHKPGFEVTGVSSAREFDRALAAGVSPQRLMAAIDWVHRGTGRDQDFWKPNALSGGAFRKQINRLEVLMAHPAGANRDVRVGRAEAAPHEAFTKTGRVDL